MTKKLILFDLDGTLLDTLEDLSEAVNHALELRGLPLHTVDEYRHMVGHGVRNLVQQALPNGTDEMVVDNALADFKAYYQVHIDVHTRPYPGIPELLTELNGRGIKMAVASNKFQEGTEYLIKRFFPEIPFVAILGNRPGAPLKPSPEIVQEVLRKADVRPEDALMVGDSPTDMRTAANGGIEALAVTWGYRSAEELTAATEARLVHSVPALRIELLGFYVSEPMRTPPATFESPLQQLIYETFASKGIDFERVDTDPGITMEDCAHISARIGVNI
ncbi:MAG: HAD family hydrolase, partial [Bacteroidales bacterium]|nr:HAD family hydrolase [Bacteroidales bacterium]